jgi:tetratricopeptide (TPR) repeat protein
MRRDRDNLELLLDNNKPLEVLKRLKGRALCQPKEIFALGEARRMLGDFEKSVKLYDKALAGYGVLLHRNGQSAEISAGILDVLLALSKSYRTLGNAGKAHQTACKALSVASAREDLFDFKMLALQEIGMALRACGKLDEAETILFDVLDYYKKQKEPAGKSFIYWALGGICRLRGQFKDGADYFKKSAALSKDKVSKAYAYCGLAGISRVSGKNKACLENYKKAEAIFKNTDDIFGKAYTNCGIANGLRQLGKYGEALKRYETAGKLYSLIKDKVDLGFVKWGFADVLKKQNRLREAARELKKAKALFANCDETRGQILTELSIAQVLYALGQRSRAIEIYDLAVSRAKAENLATYLEIFT